LDGCGERGEQMRVYALALACVAAVAGGSFGQSIDFETLPDGTATADLQFISDEYQADFGVRFDLVDLVTLEPTALPQIAKVGAPQTAFNGCGPDTLLEGEGVGSSFLTDDSEITGEAGTLLLTYTDPVAQAAGVVLDVDRRAGGAFEEWTVEALDASMSVIDTVVLTAPGGISPCGGSNGSGNGRVMGFLFDRANADISFIVLRYTGTAGSIGLAFDNFSPTDIPPAPMASASADADKPCYGDFVTLSAGVSDGLAGFNYQWQRAPIGGAFVDLTNETNATLLAPVVDQGYQYRVIVTDSIARQSVSNGVTLDPASHPTTWTLKVETAAGSGMFDTIATDISPFVFDQNIDAVYDWSQSEQYYHGAEPALTVNRSHMFLSLAPGGQSLVVVHDADDPNGGGRAEMRIDFVGVTPDYVSKDDPASDLYRGGGTNLLEIRNNWNQPNTDGFAVGPMAGDWSGAVQFTDGFIGDPTIEGLTEWYFYAADGSSFVLPLEADRRVMIEAVCTCLADLTGDGSLNFFDVSAFLSAFSAMDPAADFTGDGQFNFFDVSAFLSAFAAGCP